MIFSIIADRTLIPILVDYKAYEYPKIRRSITAEEYLEAMGWAEKWGLANLDPKSVAVKEFFTRHGKR